MVLLHPGRRPPLLTRLQDIKSLTESELHPRIVKVGVVCVSAFQCLLVGLDFLRVDDS